MSAKSSGRFVWSAQGQDWSECVGKGKGGGRKCLFIHLRVGVKSRASEGRDDRAEPSGFVFGLGFDSRDCLWDWHLGDISVHLPPARIASKAAVMWKGWFGIRVI
jgi:hypothetical protein